MKKIPNEWLFPLTFMLGFLCAWGMILVDRQMLISEQAELMRDLKQVRKQMRLRELMDDFGTDWQEIIIWNKEALKPEEAIKPEEGK